MEGQAAKQLVLADATKTSPQIHFVSPKNFFVSYTSAFEGAFEAVRHGTEESG